MILSSSHCDSERQCYHYMSHLSTNFYLFGNTMLKPDQRMAGQLKYVAVIGWQSSQSNGQLK